MTDDKKFLGLEKIQFATILAVLLTVSIIVQSVTIYRVSRLAAEGSQSHAAVCAWRQDLQNRYAGGVTFLQKHPHGIPGIPRAVIEQSIKNERSVLDSLKILNCQKGG